MERRFPCAHCMVSPISQLRGWLWAVHVTHLLADMVVREFKPLLEADVALPNCVHGFEVFFPGRNAISICLVELRRWRCQTVGSGVSSSLLHHLIKLCQIHLSIAILVCKTDADRIA